MTTDPFGKFRRWRMEAEKAGVPLPDAMALATADSSGRPSVRYMLLKSADESGFVFYTNLLSRKGRELRDNQRASIAFYWDKTGRQVRSEGRVRKVSAAEADDYWQSRPRASQLAAAASQQSASLDSRRRLLALYGRLERKYEGARVPRPREWTGFRLVPTRIEFWTRREPRLHERELFVRSAGRWAKRILQP